MVSAFVSGSSDPGSSPDRGHCVVFLGKTWSFGTFWVGMLVQQTKQAIQLGYANRILYSNILLFDLKKRTKYI